MRKQLYIAYGSNLNKEQMEYRCPTAEPIAVATLKDHKLVFQGRPYGAHANVIPAKGEEVPVVIWEITAKDEANLDIYEGVRGGYYTKEYIDIEVNGEMQEALIYIMTPNPIGIPTDEYLQTIAVGYDDFDLPISILNEAAIHAQENIGLGLLQVRETPYERTRRAVYATGNRWAIENFNATH